MLRAEEIATYLQDIHSESSKKNGPLIIIPEPNIDELKKSGSASVDLRLGCWFKSLDKSNISALSVDEPSNRCSSSSFSINQTSNKKIPSKDTYVRFGSSYVLHPRDFVLAVTLEWISMPANLAGYIHGKSSWGRRGLIIATAAVIHPGFKGCITLELTNLGEVPIVIQPGMYISQLCLHTAHTKVDSAPIDVCSFIGQRKPSIGNIVPDSVAERLNRTQHVEDESYES